MTHDQRAYGSVGGDNLIEQRGWCGRVGKVRFELRESRVVGTPGHPFVVTAPSGRHDIPPVTPQRVSDGRTDTDRATNAGDQGQRSRIRGVHTDRPYLLRNRSAQQ